ncbi:hypothetical protein GGF46_002563 [Coemansia sp. RSA 552]|nr:hypothetical protein GGF46_002563 [Coemansia sp. RSA 552]
MGISAMFRRSKTPMSPDSDSDVQKARHIKRRPTGATAPVPATGGRRRAPLSYDSSLSSSQDDTLSDGSYGAGVRGRSRVQLPSAPKKPPPINTSRGPSSRADSEVFGLHSPRTPPPDTSASQLKVLDPFEDSPPRRPLTDFEDPTYIPPLTLATTLIDDYGTAPAPSAKQSFAPAASASRAKPKAGGAEFGSLDLLSEFNTTYNYLFGTLPSDATANAATGSTGPPHGAGMARRTASSGLLSPASTEPSKTPSPSRGGQSEEERSLSGSEDESSNEGDSAAKPEPTEEERKEDERKAAELRSRRREMIKQQVAFERMKERHRRHRPEKPAGPHGSIARWQKDAATTASAANHGSTNALYASSGTINRGYMQGGAPMQHVPGQGHAVPYGGWHNGSYSNAAANASMPNIAQGPQSPQRQPPLPLVVDTAGARAMGGPGMMAGHPYSAPIGVTPQMLLPNTGAQSAPISGPGSPLYQPQIPLSAHPVKLANTPKSTTNPYLSDTSGESDSDSSSLSDGEDSSIAGSSDLSYDGFEAPAAPTPAKSGPSSNFGRPGNNADKRAPGAISGGKQLAGLPAASSADSSSDDSAKSQSSSKRRVRFHETVSVVFNTRNSVTEEELETGFSDSDNDSNSSLGRGSSRAGGVSVPSRKQAGAAEPTTADDAFDDSKGAAGLSRYQIPAAITAQSAAIRWLDSDILTAMDSKPSSSSSSGNASLEGGRGRKQRPKHRIETQPLRDREAEREAERKQQARATDRAQSEDRRASEESADFAAPAEGDAGSGQQTVDPMTAARQALLGHYSVPNPTIPVGTSIPRSGGKPTAYSRSSSVKVLGPQSFARPKNYQSSASRQNSTSRRSRFEPMPDAKAGPAARKPQEASADQRAAASVDTGADPSASKTVVRKVSRNDPVDEFDFTNVLQNFSIASFELSPGKEGGVHIRYPDRGEPSASKSGAGSVAAAPPVTSNDGDSSDDGDDIPLSTIARSKSDPASARRQLGDSRVHRSSMAKIDWSQGRPLEGKASSSSGGEVRRQGSTLAKPQGDARKQRVLVRNASYSATRSGRPAAVEGMRSMSMDSGQQPASAKRRFGKWGNLF